MKGSLLLKEIFTRSRAQHVILTVFVLGVKGAVTREVHYHRTKFS